MTDPREMVNVRYLVDDVEAAIAFYTKLLGFEVRTSFVPAFADVARGKLRLLLSGPSSSAGRPMPDGAKPGPGGWNRIHLLVDDIEAEVARLRDAGARFRSDVVEGPGGKQSRTPPATSSSSSNPQRAEREETRCRHRQDRRERCSRAASWPVRSTWR
jgi:catechol 2,3-dioxygenase-like lactoylglutathione lyase family enzyme